MAIQDEAMSAKQYRDSRVSQEAKFAARPRRDKVAHRKGQPGNGPGGRRRPRLVGVELQVHQIELEMQNEELLRPRRSRRGIGEILRPVRLRPGGVFPLGCRGHDS